MLSEKLKRGIENSEVFLVLGTRAYFEDPGCLEQIAYAKSLEKPFVVLLCKGVVIPTGIFEGIRDIQTEEVDITNENDVRTAVIKMLESKRNLKRENNEICSDKKTS